MSLEPATLLTVATLGLAGLVQSVTGFGFGLVAMTLLPLFLTFQEAYFTILIPGLAVCVLNFASNWRHFEWRHGLGLFLGSCVAVPIGFYTMLQLDADWLKTGLGILICVFASSELLMARRRPLRIPESWGWLMGLLSGGLSGAFNIGGPPAVAYVYSQTWTKEHIVALLQVVFGATSVIRLLLLRGDGMITGHLVGVSALAIVPLLLATYAGGYVLRWIPREHLRVVVFGFLLMIGTKYALNL